MQKRKVKRIVKWCFVTGLTSGILGAISFYVIVLSGLFPSVQEMWVTSAMTTMSHKWLATAFIDEDVITEILQRTYVDDDGYATNENLLDINKQEDGEGKIPIDEFGFIGHESLGDVMQVFKNTYEKEGYTRLEDGLFKKVVSGPTWKGYVMLVEDPARVKLVSCNRQFVRGDTVKTMVKKVDGVAGINAGGFTDGPNYDSNGGIPSGLLIIDGKVINSGGNGWTHSVIGMNEDNMFILGKLTNKQAAEKKIVDCVDFKPFLIVNGETIIKSGNGGWGIAPRTAMGQRKTGEILFLVIDGRQPGHSIGVDLRVLQDVLYEEGAVNAAMLDGGSSTVMVYKDEFVNRPSLGHERYINNAWVVTKKEDVPEKEHDNEQ